MKINNEKELSLFERTINECRRNVWLVTPAGEKFNLKEPVGRYRGVAEILNCRGLNEPELFAECREDEMNLLGFYSSVLLERSIA